MIGAGLAAKATAALAGPAIKKGFDIAKWLVPLLIILGLVIALRSADKDRDQLRKWQGVVTAAVAAETPPKVRKTVTSSTVVENIQWLGSEYRTHRDALERQSAALREAEAQANAAQNEAAAARKAALQRNKEREGTRARLLDPKRSTGLNQEEWSKL